MGNFTIVNGQVYTPGLAIVDAPQPNTPLGGGRFTHQNTRDFQLMNSLRHSASRHRCLRGWEAPLAPVYTVCRLAHAVPQHHAVSDVRGEVSQLYHLQRHGTIG